MKEIKVDHVVFGQAVRSPDNKTLLSANSKNYELSFNENFLTMKKKGLTKVVIVGITNIAWMDHDEAGTTKASTPRIKQ